MPSKKEIALFSLLLAVITQGVAQPVVLTNIPVSSGSLAAVNPALNRIYISAGDNNSPQTLVIDGVTFNQITVLAGWGAGVDLDNNDVWTANVYAGTVTPWNSSDVSLGSVQLADCPIAIGVDSPHRVVWVGAQCGGGNDPLWAIDADTDAIIDGPISSGGVQGPVLVNPATGLVYIAPSGVPEEINPTNFAVTSTAFGPVLAVNAAVNLLYAPNSGTNLQIINGTYPETVLTNVALPFSFSPNIGVNPVLNRIYAGNSGSNTVVILNATTGQYEGSISLGAGVTSVQAVLADDVRSRVYATAIVGGSPMLYVIQDSIVEGGVWTEKSALPAGANFPVAASVNGMAYVMGGFNGSPLSSFYSYNPLSNTWTTLPPMPGGRYQMDGAGVIGSKIYVAGGWTISPPLPNNNLWVYDTVANSWSSTNAQMPLLSADGAGGVISNKYYVTTSDDGYDGYYNFLHVYDPSLDTWTQLAGSPVPHSQPGYGVIGSKLYVAGGNDGSANSTQLDVYDPASDTWTTKSPMSTPRSGCGSAVLNGKLYVFGGYDGTNYLSSMESYDPKSDSWTTEAPMLTPTDGAAGANVNGVIYAIGGSDSVQTLSSNEAFATLNISLVSINDPVMKNPAQIASDGINLYVSGVGTNNNQCIFRVPISGGPAAIVYNALNPWQVAVIGTNLFWIDPNAGPVGDTEILRGSTTGTAPLAPIYVGEQVGQPIVDGVGLTTDGSELYAADEVDGTVWRLNPDGSGLTQLGPQRYSGYFSTEHVNTIADYQGVLYVADSGKAGVDSPQVLSIATNGSSFATLASGAPFVSPGSIAVGNGMIYIADEGATNTIWQMPISGGAPTPLVSGPPFVSIAGLAYVNGTLFVADYVGDAIYAINLPQPAISAEPANSTATSGGSTTLTVGVAGNGPFSYQWQLNGANIAGATNATLAISGFSDANAGLYTVTVNNAWGSVTSAPVSVAGVDIKMLATVVINGFPGLTYSVQSTASLSGNWTTLTNLTLESSPTLYVDYTSLTNSHQFYRVVPIP